MLGWALAVVWLAVLIIPVQVGRWCLRHGRPGAAVGMWLWAAAAIAALVYGTMITRSG
jgi:hypothetical protein